MSSFDEILESIKRKIPGENPMSGMTTYALGLAGLALAVFLGLFAMLKKKEDGTRNYKKIAMWTLFICLALIPFGYFLKINGFI